jgi:hypothetical protein
MNETMAEYRRMSTAEQRLLDVVKEGPFTFDALSTRVEMNWSQMFFAVDRLSRSRHVALRRTHSREYVVSIGAVA